MVCCDAILYCVLNIILFHFHFHSNFNITFTFSLLECKDNSADSVMSAVVGFIFFTLLLGIVVGYYIIIVDSRNNQMSKKV